MYTACRFFLVLLSVVAFPAHASDLDKEKRWADQVVDSLLDGEVVWLNDGRSDFLGIYTLAGDDQGRAVIIMHGTGIHPDWQQVIQPLRVGLTEYDWNTLSIQMPILHNDAEYLEYAPLYDAVAPRINAAIDFLREQGNNRIVLIGHSQGAAMTAYYLSNAKQDVDGFVAIGMGSFAGDPRMNSVNALEAITVPVLDLYGDEDLENVLDGRAVRTGAANKAGNMDYTQVELSGSDHFFDGKEGELVKTVATWLDKTAGN